MIDKLSMGHTCGGHCLIGGNDRGTNYPICLGERVIRCGA